MNRLPPVHPGETLLEDFMKPLGLSQCQVARDTGISAARIHQIVHAQRSITADIALRLARYLGTSAVLWLRLQAQFDLETAELNLTKQIDREVKVLQYS